MRELTFLLRPAGLVPASTHPDKRNGGYRHKAGMTLIAWLAAVLTTPAPAQTQTRMNADAATAYQRADAAMTAQWKRTYAYMKGRDAQNGSRGGGFGYAAATLASQRAWLAFRTAQCAIEAGEFAGGSMQPLARAQCLTRLTKERSIQLRNLMWNR